MLRLTDKQRQRIARYLREYNERLQSLPEQERESRLSALRQRIRGELEPYSESVPRDEDVERALARADNVQPEPEQAVANAGGLPAAEPLESAGEDPAFDWTPLDATAKMRTGDGRRWLGVCAYIAGQLRVEPLAIRWLAIVLGIGTGPLALWAYLVTYFVLFAMEDARDRPALPWLAIGKRLGPILGWLFGIYVGTHYSIRGINWLMVQYAGTRLRGISSEWFWYLDSEFQWFLAALAFALPFTLLSALPVPLEWQGTLKKLGQACIALYALFVAYALGSLLTGILLALTQTLDTNSLGEAISEMSSRFF